MLALPAPMETLLLLPKKDVLITPKLTSGIQLNISKLCPNTCHKTYLVKALF